MSYTEMSKKKPPSSPAPPSRLKSPTPSVRKKVTMAASTDEDLLHESITETHFDEILKYDDAMKQLRRDVDGLKHTMQSTDDKMQQITKLSKVSYEYTEAREAERIQQMEALQQKVDDMLATLQQHEDRLTSINLAPSPARSLNSSAIGRAPVDNKRMLDLEHSLTEVESKHASTLMTLEERIAALESRDFVHENTSASEPAVIAKLLARIESVESRMMTMDVEMASIRTELTETREAFNMDLSSVKQANDAKLIDVLSSLASGRGVTSPVKDDVSSTPARMALKTIRQQWSSLEQELSATKQRLSDLESQITPAGNPQIKVIKTEMAQLKTSRDDILVVGDRLDCLLHYLVGSPKDLEQALAQLNADDYSSQMAVSWIKLISLFKSRDSGIDIVWDRIRTSEPLPLVIMHWILVSCAPLADKVADLVSVVNDLCGNAEITNKKLSAVDLTSLQRLSDIQERLDLVYGSYNAIKTSVEQFTSATITHSSSVESRLTKAEQSVALCIRVLQNLLGSPDGVPEKDLEQSRAEQQNQPTPSTVQKQSVITQPQAPSTVSRQQQSSNQPNFESVDMNQSQTTSTFKTPGRPMAAPVMSSPSFPRVSDLGTPLFHKSQMSVGRDRPSMSTANDRQKLMQMRELYKEMKKISRDEKQWS